MTVHHHIKYQRLASHSQKMKFLFMLVQGRLLAVLPLSGTADHDTLIGHSIVCSWVNTQSEQCSGSWCTSVTRSSAISHGTVIAMPPGDKPPPILCVNSPVTSPPPLHQPPPNQPCVSSLHQASLVTSPLMCQAPKGVASRCTQTNKRRVSSRVASLGIAQQWESGTQTLVQICTKGVVEAELSAALDAPFVYRSERNVRTESDFLGFRSFCSQNRFLHWSLCLNVVFFWAGK